MNDPIKTPLSPIKEHIMAVLLVSGALSSSQIAAVLNKKATEAPSLVTVKRALGRLVQDGSVNVAGVARSTRYTLSLQGRLLAPVDAHTYCAEEPDQRGGAATFDIDLLSLRSPLSASTFDPFTNAERVALAAATNVFNSEKSTLSDTLHKKELERFVIELSWKSSKIEGNTYTLLDTERLLNEGVSAPGHSREETQMIVNHKRAFDFIWEHRLEFAIPALAQIEEVHKLLTADMGVSQNLRRKAVGITGSSYRPLDNEYQVREASEQLLELAKAIQDGYTRALVVILGIMYIQPFEDGNKRTARLVGNALLLACGLAPLSYRSVDEVSYREAALVFYELGSLAPFKKLFVEQYDFAARNYSLKI